MILHLLKNVRQFQSNTDKEDKDLIAQSRPNCKYMNKKIDQYVP